LGGYVYFSGRAALREKGPELLKSGSRVGLQGRMMGLMALSSTLVALGAYRLVN